MDETPLDLFLAACEAEGIEPNVHLLDLLSRGPLFEICASEQPLGRKGGAALAAVLARDRDALVVKLEACELYDAGVQAVCEALCGHPAIFRLDLGYNGCRSLKPLAELLQRCHSLLCVDLSGNSLAPSLLGWSPLAPLSEALSSELCRLQLLQLGNCDLGLRGLESLCTALQANT